MFEDVIITDLHYQFGKQVKGHGRQAGNLTSTKLGKPNLENLVWRSSLLF